MNVARGRNVFSILQKGYGARAGSVSMNNFLGGFHVPNNRREEEKRDLTLMTTRSVDFGRRFLSTEAAEAKHTAPTMEMAKAMPLSCKEMNNSDLVMLGSMGNADARKEILIRHIMSVDNASYDDAYEVFQKIAAKNREGMWLLTVPYKFGIGVAFVLAVGSIPMVFDINTVSWFNEFYVTADVPEPKDLETPLEVGAWAWNWMEPPLGQMSFFLLCMQYTRAQIANIGIRPYTEKIMAMRATKLAQAFPQYDAKVIVDFSEAITFYDDKHGIRA